MRGRIVSTAILGILTPILLAASPPIPALGMATAGDSEQSFLARADKFFAIIAAGKDFVTRSQLRARYSSPTRMIGDQPVPFQLHEARFSCVDVNKDGRISIIEYRQFAKAIFKSASVNGILNLANPQELTKYQNALKSCAPR